MAVPASEDDETTFGAEGNETPTDETSKKKRKVTTPVGPIEPRSVRPFKTDEEYLYAMKEDLAEWLQSLYEDVDVYAENFFEVLETGVLLCRHANHVLRGAREAPGASTRPWPRVTFREGVQPGTFQARDNVSQFIGWCRGWLRVKECLLFETDDLVERKNERNVVLCLLEVARRGCDLCEGMPAPMLVQMEREIDAEMARDERLRRRPNRLLDAATMTTTLGVIESSDDGGGNGHEADDDRSEETHSDDDQKPSLPPRPQIITNDLRSLHQRVADLLNRCSCPSQFPMLRVADGKYRIGDTQVLIFVRVLRNHVMVRVGGGWDTLEHYLEKHDPCRGRSGRRLSSVTTPVSGKQKWPTSQPRPRSCGTPSGRAAATPTSPPSRRLSCDLSRLESPEDRRRCSSVSGSRGRLQSPRHNNEEDAFAPYARHGRRQYSGGSSSEVSEESVELRDTWRMGHRQKRQSPRKVMRYGENGVDDSEPDSIYSSPPRSMDSFRQSRCVSKPAKAPPSFGSDDSAVSLGCADEPLATKTPKSRIPKSRQSSHSLSSGRNPRDSHLTGRMSSSRSETTLFSPYAGGSGSRTPSSSRGRRTSPSVTRKSSGYLPRSNSGISVSEGDPYVSSYRSRRPPSSTSSSPGLRASPTKDRRPSSAMSTPKSGRCRSTSSSCQSSPGKSVAPLLEEILQDSDVLDTDEKLLKHMEKLINQYRARAGQDGSTDNDEEDPTEACFSLSPDDDTSISSSLRCGSLSLGRIQKVVEAKRTTSALSARSPSKIPVYTAWIPK